MSSIALAAFTWSLLASGITIDVGGFNISPADGMVVVAWVAYCLDSMAFSHLALNKRLLKPIIIFVCYWIGFMLVQALHHMPSMALLKNGVNDLLTFAIFILFAQQPASANRRALDRFLILGVIAVFIAVPMYMMGYTSSESPGNVGRLDSFFWGASNAFAVKVVLLAIISVMLGIVRRRNFYVGLGGLFLLAILLTQSKGALLAILVVMGWVSMTGKARRKFWGIVLLLGILGIGFILFTHAGDLLWERIVLFESDLRAYMDHPTPQTLAVLGGGRLERWQQAWQQFQANLLIGGGWKIRYISYRWSIPRIFEDADPHNWILSTLARGGVVALALVLAMLLTVMKPMLGFVHQNWRSRSSDRRVYLVYAILMGTIAVFIQALIEDVFRRGVFPASGLGYLLWSMLGIGFSNVLGKPCSLVSVEPVQNNQ